MDNRPYQDKCQETTNTICMYSRGRKNNVSIPETRNRRNRRMKAIPCELHIYWNDGVTIECRKFPSILSAKRYVKNEGIKKYSIERL